MLCSLADAYDIPRMRTTADEWLTHAHDRGTLLQPLPPVDRFKLRMERDAKVREFAALFALARDYKLRLFSETCSTFMKRNFNADDALLVLNMQLAPVVQTDTSHAAAAAAADDDEDD